MSYTIKLGVVNKTSDMLTLVEKTCWYYANGGTWTQQEDNYLLSIGGSGTSGVLRFQTSAKETFCLAIGVHNYKRWCDIVVDLNDNDTAMKIHPTYYSDSSRHKMLWNQLSKITKHTPKARALRVNFLLDEGNELHAEFTYDEQKYSDAQTEMIYTVLQAIGEPDYVKNFSENGITDLWFPFSQESLPYGLPPATYAKFQEIQNIVLTGAIDLEKGKHFHLSRDDLDEYGFPKQLQWKADLGSGGFGSVYKVLGAREYALKRIPRGRTLKNISKVMKYLEKELAVLKKIRKLQSQHFVTLIGSYTSIAWTGLVVFPAADDNLTTFLSKVSGATDKRTLLCKFFGCLLSALADLHSTLRIQHNNIKPQNILIKANNVLFTDFGMAIESDERGHTTTNEESSRFSVYDAPEAVKLNRFALDIWSLGCVYLEMVTVLKGETKENIRQFFSSKGSKERSYWMNQEAISLWIKRLQDIRGPEFENEPLQWVSMMLHQKAGVPLDARQLRDIILETRPDADSSMAFCGDCCKGREIDRNSADLELTSRLSDDNTTVTTSSVPFTAEGMDAILLSNGFDIKGNDSRGLRRIGLHWAAENGYEAVVQHLLENGADVMTRDNRGRTALHLAAVHGHRAITRLLLEEGADIDAQDDRGTTALLCAITNGQGGVVQGLLEKGADVGVKNDRGWAALHAAAINGDDEVVWRLLENDTDVNPKDKDYWTPLHWAAQMGHIRVVRLLLEKDADVGAEDMDGWTPVHRATKRRHMAIIELLGEGRQH